VLVTFHASLQFVPRTHTHHMDVKARGGGLIAAYAVSSALNNIESRFAYH